MLVLALGVPVAEGRLLEAGSYPGKTGVSVFSIDPTTGAYTLVVPGPILIGLNTSFAYDPAGQRWFSLARGASPGDSRLETLEDVTRTVRAVHLTVCCGPIQYDPKTDRVLEAVTEPFGGTTPGVYSIDASTGAVTQLIDTVLPVGRHFTYDAGAYDAINQRWFFTASPALDRRLYIVNIAFRSVASVPTSICACGPLAYDSARDRVLALAASVTDPDNTMFSINPTTGEATGLFHANIPFVFFLSSEAFDPVTQQWFFLSPQSTGHQLYVADIAGKTVTPTRVATCCGPLGVDNAPSPIPMLDPRAVVFLALTLVSVGLWGISRTA